MPFTLPLFPLDVVLFPRMPLPLHIFEPRYRRLVSRCLQTDRTFGVIHLAEGRDPEGNSFADAVGCSTEIVQSTSLDDGRFHIQTIGRRRFKPAALEECDGYLVASVEWIDDEEPEADAERIANQALRSLRRYLGAIGSSLGETAALPGVPDNAHDVSMWIASLLNAPPSQKQQLLRTVSTAARLKYEVVLLERAQIVEQAWVKKQKAGGEALGPRTRGDSDYSRFFSLN